MTDKKGTYWIDKLKDLFKEEKIDEEDDSWYQNTGSQVDTEQFGNFSDEDGSRSNSQDGEEISFLAKDRNQQKDMNRQIYMKIADAFMHEDSTLIEKDEDSNSEDEGTVQFQQQELAKKSAIKEFDTEFIKSRDSLKLKPQLDIVEMNVFDRIALYQDHTIWQKIYKKVWYIKSMITAIALKIVKSRPFEVASLCVIAVNSVMLALDDPTTNDDNNATMDLTLLIIYTVEMCFKIVALGFIMDATSYMRDYWNIVDIVIIGTGYLPYLVSGSSFNLSALRSLRVLRPLKSITKIKALKQLLTALFSAIPLLKDSIIILMFFFIIFGIAGLQLFTGQLKSRCIDPQTGIMTGDDYYQVVVCSTDTDCSGYSNSNGLSYICAKSMVSPVADTIQFDTFGWSVLNVYQIVSLEGWTKIMNLMQDGFNQFSVLYFFVAVYIGAFFLLNLTMAIIGVKYSEAINDQKDKVAAVVEEPGYDMKQLIEWGLYKSNKIYYQELEEDKKIKRSLFGFSFLSLSRNMKSSEKLKKNQSSETPPERAALLPPPPLGAVGSELDANGLKKVESQQLVLPSPIPLINNPSGIQTNVNLNNPQAQGTVVPLGFSSVIAGKKQPNSPNDSSPVGKKRGQEKLISKIETPAAENLKQPQAPSFKNNAAFGSSMRSLRGGNLAGKTKILSKRIMKIENGQLKKLPLAPKKQSPKNSDLSPTRNANNSDHFPGSQNANQTEENPEPNSAEDKQSKSPRSSQHNSTNLILPHVLVGQLEQINKKNSNNNNKTFFETPLLIKNALHLRLDQGVVLSRDKSGNTSSRPRQRDGSKAQDQDSPAGIQVGDGDRKVNLVPLQNKAVSQLRQTQNVTRSSQHHGTKKISGIPSTVKQFSRQTQVNNASGSVSPGGTYYQQNNDDNENGVCVLGQNYLNPQGGFQLGVRKSVLGSTEIMNAVGRRGSRKNARRGENTHIIHQTIIGATQINQTHVQNITNDDWMNDDFLKEIEAKQKANKKAAAAAANNGDKSPIDSETHLSVGGDVQIEENYFSNSMPINMLKQQKEPILMTQIKPKQSNNRDSSVHPLQKKESLEAGDCITSPRKKHGHDRNGSVSGRGLSSKRIRTGNQSNSAYHSNSKTKTITQFDQFSEESDISINRPAGADPINSPSGGDKSPIHNNQKDASILFNDGEFLEIFGGKKKEQMKVVRLEDRQKKQKKQLKHKTTLREQKSSFNEFKRQESRNITKVVNNYGRVDDKFDIKKEEILLLLENAHLKARVIYDEPYDYVDDIQPQKRRLIKEKKRLEQHNKLKKLRFVIDYSNQRGGKNKKTKTFANIDKSRTFPVRRSDVIDYLLNDNNPFNVLGNENLDPILKEDGISKKISQAGEKVGSQPNYDGQSFMNPHFNKLTVNLEPSIKEISSLQNIEKDLENSDQINNNLGNRGELPSGRKININHLDSKLGSEDNQASIQDLQAAIIGKDGVSLPKSGTENKIIEMEADAGLKNLKRLGTQGGVSVPGSGGNNTSTMHQTRLPNDNSGAISRNRVGISSMKNSSRAVATEKGGKQKKKGDNEVKWTFNLALTRIFSDVEVTDIHQEAKKVKDFDFVFAGDVSNKESKMTLTTMKTKDSRMSDGSDSASKLNSMGMSSNNSLSRDSESVPNSVNHPSKEEDGKAKIDEAFANEPVENKFMKIRKNEIHNLERKGINKVNTEWSASAILPISLFQKSQKSLDRILTTINHTKYDAEQNEGGIIGIIQALRRRVKYFVQSSVFDNSIMLCVILNTVILSLDGLVDSTEGQDLMSQFNTIFTIVFAVDMGLKITGYGLSEYVADKMNIFDAFIVSLSLFEMIFLTGSGSSFSAFRAIRILRVFRVLRVTRLIRSLQFMKLMITALGSAISQFIYILLLLFLFMFIYTLLGMSIFGGNLNVHNPPTKMVFDDFFSAAFSVLDLLTVENWNDLKTLCIRSNDVNNYISVAYLISWIFIGNYVFMNLVLAIIMDSFDSDEVKEDKKDIENQFEVVADLDLNHQSIGTTFLGQTTSLNMGSTFNQSNQSGGLNRSQTSLSKGIVGSGSNLKNSQQQIQSPGQQNDSLSQRSSTKKESDLQEKDKINKIEEEDDDDGDDDKKKTKGKQFSYFEGVYCQKSFYILSQKNIFRRLLYRFYKNPIFEQSVFVAIMLSSLKLTIDTYVSDETSLIYTVGNKIDIVFTAFFATESVVKMISLGFVMDKASYLRDEWSQLDFFIVICSLIDVSVTSIDLSVIKIFRLLRTLRPLRLLNHNKSMKLIVTALMESVGGISNMIIVVILIWLMFGILGLNLMKDKLQYCDFNSTTNYDLYSYHQAQCSYIPGATWSTYDINCDNIGNAMLFLFILSSFEGWPAYVYNFIDASDSGPIHASSAYFAVFFAVFIFVGSFFSINLFSAIMAFNFDIASKKAKNEFLTDQQSQWIELQRLIIQSTPDFASMRQPTNRFRFFLWKIVTSQKLEVFIIMCIMANIVTMAMAYDTSPSSYDQSLQYLNYGFTGVFILECILKIIAFGPGGYFFSSWNKFDFFVVVASIVDIITTQIGQQLLSFMKAGPQLIRVMRVLRVSRLLKLIKSFQNLQKLIQTTIFALPSLLNATALFLLFYFIFSILSCYLFSHVTSGNIVNHLNNFDNFHQAFIILFRCSTGEDWMTVMFDVVRLTNPYSIIFFLFFIVTQSYIMMNLFVLIIMNEFEENYIDPDNPLQNFREQEESFKALWVIMTQKDFGVKIHERFLTDFYFALPQPLGYDYETRRKQFTENLKLHNRSISDDEIQIKCDKFKVKQKQEADKHIMQMNIFCDYEGYIYFNELFFFFFKFSLEEKLNEIEPNRTPEKNFTALSIVRKEEVISLKKINFLKKKQSQLMKQKITHKRKEGVNPMVRKLFVSMCFSSWLSYSKNTQNKINEMNFNNEDISSESDTDSDAEGENDKSDLFKAEEEEGIQFRLPNGKKAIIQREHTIFQRIKGLKDREADNLIEHDKYLFLPNTEIYKDDFIQMGEGANYYSQRVFSTQIDPLALKTIGLPDKVSTPHNVRDSRNGSIVVIGGSNIPSKIIQAEQQLLVGGGSLSPSNQRGSFKVNNLMLSSKNANNPIESPSSPDELSFLNRKENEVEKSKNVSHQGSNGFSHSDSKNSKVNSQHNNEKENNENGVYHNLEETNTIQIKGKSDSK